ncbi:hypothetical protein IMZ48_03070 [Candidatus Bathyarchaeota archaeon]|nr:hypothetical protein [Candidatus Bathyarchaeota archaeon]
MQAALSTLYLLAFTVSYFRSTSSAKNTKHDSNLHLNEPREDALRIPDIPNPALGQRKLDAFRGSLDTFFTTSMIMSVAMLCAAIYLAVESGKGRKTPYWEQVLPFGDSSVYNMVVSVTASGFSVFPVIVIAMQVWPPLFPQVAFREIDTEILASFRVMDWL